MHASYKLMHDLNARAATKYDPLNPIHEKKLNEVNLHVFQFLLIVKQVMGNIDAHCKTRV